MIKVEFNGVPIQNFIGLRSKMYAVKRSMNDEEVQDGALSNNSGLTKKTNGIKKVVIRNGITLNHFVVCRQF